MTVFFAVVLACVWLAAVAWLGFLAVDGDSSRISVGFGLCAMVLFAAGVALAVSCEETRDRVEIQR